MWLMKILFPSETKEKNTNISVVKYIIGKEKRRARLVEFIFCESAFSGERGWYGVLGCCYGITSCALLFWKSGELTG